MSASKASPRACGRSRTHRGSGANSESVSAETQRPSDVYRTVAFCSSVFNSSTDFWFSVLLCPQSNTPKTPPAKLTSSPKTTPANQATNDKLKAANTKSTPSKSAPTKPDSKAAAVAQTPTRASLRSAPEKPAESALTPKRASKDVTSTDVLETAASTRSRRSAAGGRSESITSVEDKKEVREVGWIQGCKSSCGS